MKLKIVGVQVIANRRFMINGAVLVALFPITSRRIICLNWEDYVGELALIHSTSSWMIMKLVWAITFKVNMKEMLQEWWSLLVKSTPRSCMTPISINGISRWLIIQISLASLSAPWKVYWLGFMNLTSLEILNVIADHIKWNFLWGTL